MDCLFVGAGAIAEAYADALSGTDLTLAGVCDINRSRAVALADTYAPEAAVFADLEAALAGCDAPLVVNLTGHRAHAEVTRTALTAGRHVYSQKPLALDGETAADLVTLAADRGLGLRVAPDTPDAPAQRLSGRLLADGRLDDIGVVYAHAHVGRVTEWHDRPDAFLAVGPLYDGAVYPLTLLTAWFGPVRRVRTADALDIWPEHADRTPETHSHVEATLEFDGPVVRLSASLYVPHRGQEFYGMEIHGDEGSLYLEDTGAMSIDRDTVQFGRAGREYAAVPPQTPTEDRDYIDAVVDFAADIAAGRSPRDSARRGAHVTAVCNAVEQAVTGSDGINVPDRGVSPKPVAAPTIRPAEETPVGNRPHALRLPSIGFGCSRYRGDRYVDRVDSIATALDAGYRLLDTAELYGNEHRIGTVLDAPGAPDRDSLFVLGKAWRTNHRREHLLEACAGSLDELGIDTFDCYTLHWPTAWAHTDSLERLAEKPIDKQEALTFPETETGERATADVPLAQAWRNLEAVHERDWARRLGICNVDREQLETIHAVGSVDPAVVQVEVHPYRPQRDLIEYCHDHGIRVIAHSPLSAPGLLEEPVLEAIGEEHGLSPAEVVVAWNRTRGVVPIPSSTTPTHIVANLAAGAERLDAAAMARVDELADPTFER